MARVSRGDAVALVLSILLPLGAGAVGAGFTSGAIPTWYGTLEKPSWNPPAWLFAPVWSFLYITMGVAAWLVWRAGRARSAAVGGRARSALVLYGAQLAVNALWSPVFFGARRIDLALAVIVVLLALIVATIRSFYQVRPLASILLVPYLGWVAFATALNAAIWQLNR